MPSSLEQFAESLSAAELTETEIAVGLLWFRELEGAHKEDRPSTLAKLMHELGLRGNVNVSRLASQLQRHPHIIRGTKADTVRVRLGSKAKLNEQFGSYTTPAKPKIQSLVIQADEFNDTRKYLEALVEEINGTYQLGFYNACAVIVRRLMETLVIEAFEIAGHGAAIKNRGEYQALSEIIAIARSGHYIKLARGIGASMEKIKAVADTAAHHRTYLTKQADIDDLKHEIRRVVSELAYLAKI